MLRKFTLIFVALILCSLLSCILYFFNSDFLFLDGAKPWPRSLKPDSGCANRTIQVLHLTYHWGTAQEIFSVAELLNEAEFFCYHINVTWEKPHWYDVNTSTIPWAKNWYVWTPYRIRLVRQHFQSYFEKFDLFITSDTAPVSRLFLQPPRIQRPLLVWICNRFDWGNIEDTGYRDLVNSSLHLPDVRFIPNSDVEWWYARKYRDVHIPQYAIQPNGVRTKEHVHFPLPHDYPKDQDLSEMLWVAPYYNENKKHCHVRDVLTSLGVKFYYPSKKRYGGPLAVRPFRAALHIPYSPSTIAFWENLYSDVPYFIPSRSFMDKLYHDRKLCRKIVYQITYTNRAYEHVHDSLTPELMNMSEWWSEQNSRLFIHFDSWDDLRVKFNSLDLDAKREEIKEFSNKKIDKELHMWANSFNEVLKASKVS